MLTLSSDLDLWVLLQSFEKMHGSLWCVPQEQAQPQACLRYLSRDFYSSKTIIYVLISIYEV